VDIWGGRIEIIRGDEAVPPAPEPEAAAQAEAAESPQPRKVGRLKLPVTKKMREDATKAAAKEAKAP
jgi:hypothetical protein